MGVLIVTMVSLVIGGLVVYGACSLDRVNEHPTLFYAMDSLRSAPTLISRRSRSCLDCLMQSCRKARVEAYEVENDSNFEYSSAGHFALDLLSTVAASTCRNQRDLTHDVRFGRVVSMLRGALDGQVHSQGNARELVLPNMAHPGSHGGDDEAPANVEDIMFNFVEPNVLGRSSMDARAEYHVGQTNQGQFVPLELLLGAHDFVDVASERDPMAALEELEHGLYNAQAAITFSEREYFSDTSGSSDYSGSTAQS
eukprot:TRINITY_DN4423_c0_g6_i1.p1 TRINITY_DN4423_c0_g6~~TRINITY_DN4423_c0_g6_i1.p1  ORF type:complete len:276 (-),score=28.36 TRINITY_DN4423_c0_g6_i1:32-793(-)